MGPEKSGSTVMTYAPRACRSPARSSCPKPLGSGGTAMISLGTPSASTSRAQLGQEGRRIRHAFEPDDDDGQLRFG